MGTETSGENLAVNRQKNALQRAGHDVDLWEASPKKLQDSWMSQVRQGIRLASSGLARNTMPQAESKDHLLLVNNFFPMFPVQDFQAWSGPIVLMLHNFRVFCGNGLFFRGEEICTKCLNSKGNLPAVIYGCYRGSRIQSALWARQASFASNHDGLLKHAGVVVSQTQSVFRYAKAAGLGNGRVRLIPGFVEQARLGEEVPPRSGFVFAGRLSNEKGILELLRSWPPFLKLDVIGTGPQLQQAQQIVESRGMDMAVSFIGNLDPINLIARLQRYVALVFPGKVMEGAVPQVVREALSTGTPCIAVEGSSAADLVRSENLGVVIEEIDEVTIRRAVNVFGGNAQLNARCQRYANDELSEEMWTSRMEDAFSEAIYEAS